MSLVETFRSRLPSIPHRQEPMKEPDPIAVDARKRAWDLYFRLLQERESRGTNSFEIAEVKNGKKGKGKTWQVELIEPESHEKRLGSSFFVLIRKENDVRTSLLQRKPKVKKVEEVVVYRWFVDYMNFGPPFEYLQLNSEKTLKTAEAIVDSLFPKNA